MGDVHAMRLVGGHPAVDFVNTLGGLKDRPDDEYLHAYGDLLVWSERTRLIDSELTGTRSPTPRSARSSPGSGRAPRSSAPSGRWPTPSWTCFTASRSTGSANAGTAAGCSSTRPPPDHGAGAASTP